MRKALMTWRSSPLWWVVLGLWLMVLLMGTIGARDFDAVSLTLLTFSAVTFVCFVWVVLRARLKVEDGIVEVRWLRTRVIPFSDIAGICGREGSMRGTSSVTIVLGDGGRVRVYAVLAGGTRGYSMAEALAERVHVPYLT